MRQSHINQVSNASQTELIKGSGQFKAIAMIGLGSEEKIICRHKILKRVGSCNNQHSPKILIKDRSWDIPINWKSHFPNYFKVYSNVICDIDVKRITWFGASNGLSRKS